MVERSEAFLSRNHYVNMYYVSLSDDSMGFCPVFLQCTVAEL
jgi:hypothetical protein